MKRKLLVLIAVIICMVGVSYGTDFSKVWDYADCKFNTASITLGYCF